MVVLPPAADGRHKDASAAWVAGGSSAGAGRAVPEHLREAWEERAAITAASHVSNGHAQRRTHPLGWPRGLLGFPEEYAKFLAVALSYNL